MVEEKIKKCKDCNKEFKQTKKARYERKYCPECSKQRKKDYENLYLVNAEDCEDE